MTTWSVASGTQECRSGSRGRRGEAGGRVRASFLLCGCVVRPALPVLFSRGSNDRHLHIRGIIRAADYIKSALSQGLKIKVPVPGSSGHYDSRDSILREVWADQVRITAIRQAFVAKDNLDRLF